MFEWYKDGEVINNYAWARYRFQLVCLSFWLCLYLYICLSVYLLLFVCLSVYLSICLSVYLSIYYYICLSVYLSLFKLSVFVYIKCVSGSVFLNL
jgi:hypothetical protein